MQSRVLKLKLYLHFTKSLKRDSICKLCFWIMEDHICLTLTDNHVLKLRYRACASVYVKEYLGFRKINQA